MTKKEYYLIKVFETFCYTALFMFTACVTKYLFLRAWEQPVKSPLRFLSQCVNVREHCHCQALLKKQSHKLTNSGNLLHVKNKLLHTVTYYILYIL